MNSPSHRENILRKDYSEVGFATANGLLNGEETTIVVQMFGKPLPVSLAGEPPLRPEIANAKLPSIQENPVLNEQPSILAQKSSSQNNRVGRITFNSSLIFLAFLFLAVILDLYFSFKLRVIRITGKNLADLIFIGFGVVPLVIATGLTYLHMKKRPLLAEVQNP